MTGIEVSIVSKSTALTNPAIPRIRTAEKKTFSPPSLEAITDITGTIATLTQETRSPNHRASEGAKSALKSLPVTLLLEGHLDKATVAASAAYKLKLTTPDELLGSMAKAVAKNAAQLITREPNPERLTLGGLFTPGLRASDLREDPRFVAASVQEALTSEAHSGNPNLAVMFPKHAPKVKPPAVNELERAIASATFHAHQGCCGAHLIAENHSG